MDGRLLAVHAGLFAAVASLFGKLAMASKLIKHVCMAVGYYIQENWDMVGTLNKSKCLNSVKYVRLGCFGCVFLFNAIMWTCFVKALRKCESTAQAALINTATNFLCCAIFGQFIYGETLSLLWWVGISMIISGLVVINFGGKELVDEDQVKKEQ